jgi:hypothetical protein
MLVVVHHTIFLAISINNKVKDSVVMSTHLDFTPSTGAAAFGLPWYSAHCVFDKYEHRLCNCVEKWC